MPALRTLLFLFGLLSCLTLEAQLAPPRAHFQDLHSLMSAAQSSGQPYMVCVISSKQRTSKKLNRELARNPDLQSHWQHSYLHAVIKLEDVPAGWMAKYHIHIAPSILIFHPSHRLMGRIDGFVASSTLSAILSKHLARLNPKPNYHAPILVQAPRARINWDQDHLSGPSFATRGTETQTSTARPVKGLSSYALTHLPYQEAPQIGIVYNSFPNQRQLEKKLSQVKKSWRKDIWIYQIPNPEGKGILYCMALGTFAKEEKANFYANAMRKQFGISPKLVNLSEVAGR